MFSGVPQGSVLGLVLFILFINNVSSIQSSLRLFADDCDVFREVANLKDCQALQKIYIVSPFGRRPGTSPLMYLRAFTLG